MKIGRRMMGLTLTGVGLLTLGIGVAAAREFPRPNPYDLQPGIREEGRYTEVIPGTYGRLVHVPILHPGTEGPITTASFAGGGAATAQAPTIGDCGHVSKKSAPAPISSSSAAQPKEPTAIGGLPMGNALGSAGSNRVDDLENDLRDIARRLNSQ